MLLTDQWKYEHQGTHNVFKAVADPGIPVGACQPRGSANSRHTYISKKLYVKIKESGPLKSCAACTPLDRLIYWCLYRNLCMLPKRFGKKDLWIANLIIVYSKKTLCHHDIVMSCRRDVRHQWSLWLPV